MNNENCYFEVISTGRDIGESAREFFVYMDSYFSSSHWDGGMSIFGLG